MRQAEKNGRQDDAGKRDERRAGHAVALPPGRLQAGPCSSQNVDRPQNAGARHGRQPQPNSPQAAASTASRKPISPQAVAPPDADAASAAAVGSSQRSGPPTRPTTTQPIRLKKYIASTASLGNPGTAPTPEWSPR